MAEYIDRDAFKKMLMKCFARADKKTPDKVRVSSVINELELFPTADVAPVVHGVWNGEGDGYADGEIVLDVWYCSECNHCIDDGTDDPELLPKYCPECGAKMDGGAV